MSFAIYYKAERTNPVTEQEKKNVLETVERFCKQYPFSNKVEDFGIYDFQKESDIIFHGSTKLPDENPEILFETANYWLKCLTEITYILSEAEWVVTFDDVSLIFDEQTGWRFPNDEEI